MSEEQREVGVDDLLTRLGDVAMRGGVHDSDEGTIREAMDRIRKLEAVAEAAEAREAAEPAMKLVPGDDASLIAASNLVGAECEYQQAIFDAVYAEIARRYERWESDQDLLGPDTIRPKHFPPKP